MSNVVSIHEANQSNYILDDEDNIIGVSKGGDLTLQLPIWMIIRDDIFCR